MENSHHEEEEEEEEEEKETAEDKLHRKLMNLQQDWDSIKQRRSSRSYSTNKHSSNAVVKALQLLETSPRNLMSSLQHSMLSPNLEGAWKVRTNDFAVQEIIRERREAIESGKVKGRRKLFHDVDDDETDQIMGFEDQSHNCGFEVRSVSFNDSNENESDGSKDDQINPFRSEGCSYNSGSSYSSSSSLPGDLNVERDVMEERDEERKVISNGGGGININGVRYMVSNVILKWVVISCSVVAVCIFIISFLGNGGGETQNYKVILVPT